MPKRRGNDGFGEWLDITLSNKGIMGRTLAEAIGVHDSAVSRWRSGTGVPAMAQIEPMAELLGVDALRLSVTVGLVSETVAGAPKLPTPAPTAQRESVKRQLARLRGVTEEERSLLLQAYEDANNERMEK